PHEATPQLEVPSPTPTLHLENRDVKGIPMKTPRGCRWPPPGLLQACEPRGDVAVSAIARRIRRRPDRGSDSVLVNRLQRTTHRTRKSPRPTCGGQTWHRPVRTGERMRYDVVVTGLGAVTPLGRSARQSWRRALEGSSGIRAVSRFDASRLRTRIAGEAPDLEPTEFMDARLAQRVDRFIHLGVAAACMAAKDAGLSPKNGSARSRLAVTMGN